MEIKQDSALYERIEKALGDLTSIETFSNDAKNFTGNPFHVQSLLDFMKTDNVYEAVNNLHLRNIQVGLKDKTEVIVSRSGHKMTQQAYQFINRKDPSGQTYDCGIELAISLFQTFGNAEQKGIYVDKKLSDKVKRENKETQPQTLEDVIGNLEDLEENPGLIDQVSNPNLRRKLNSYLQLNSELKQLLLSIDELSYGNTATLHSKKAHFSLAADYGGAVMGWLGRKIKDDFNSVPEEIVEAYTNLKSDFLELGTNERKLLFSALCQYEATERTVNAKVALGNYLDDLEYLLDLSAEDSFVSKYGKPDLSKVRGILEEGGEIKKIDVPQIFNIPQVARIRESVNSSCEMKYEEDLKIGKHTLKSLFMDGDYWKDDSKKSSVPMGRLKKHTLFATLMQKDFDFVKNYLLMDTLTPDPKRRYKSHSIKQFQDVVEGTVKAVRKVMYLENFLEERSLKVADSDNGFAIVNRFKHQMLRGQNYELVENFEEEQRISLAEVIKRADIYKKDYSAWKNHSRKLKKLEQFGLYNPEDISEVQPIINEMKTLTPYSPELKSEFKKLIDYFSGHSEVVELKTLRLPIDTQPYLFESQAEGLLKMIEAREVLESKEEQSPEIVQELFQAKLYSGNVKAGRIMVSKIKNALPQKNYGPVVLIDTDKVKDCLSSIKEYYVKVSEDWIEKARYLTSFKAEDDLKEKGLEPSFKCTWRIMRNVSEGDYFHKDLVELIDRL